MQPVKISKRNIMFTRPWSYEGDSYHLNLGLILGLRHNFLIDTGLGDACVASVLEYLKDDKKPLIVANTHADWDHIWGNHVFADCQIIAHQNCFKMLEKHWDEVFEKLKHKANGKVVKCLPNVTFTDKINFHEDGVSIFYTPGHTPTCISVYDHVDKVLYAGDNIGDTNEEILPVINTDNNTFKRLLEIYEAIGFEICISGHNVPQKKDVVARMAAALELKEHGRS